MKDTLEKVLSYLRNWFVDQILTGEYTVSGGSLSLDIANGQHIKINGSKFNDGVYEYPVRDLTDETFTGEIWVLNVPKSLLRVCDRIDIWMAKTGDSGYTSESFGGYSYSRDKDGTDWRKVFDSDLGRFKKL